MPESNDHELPGSTLPGAQTKYLAELIDGRYVAVEAPGPLHIPNHPAPPIDPAKVAAFTYEPAPLSIVDVFIEQHKKYTHDCTMRMIAMETAKASTELEGLYMSEEDEEGHEQYVRGEMTTQECVDDALQRYSQHMPHEDNSDQLDDLERRAIARRKRLVDAGALITEWQLLKALDISPQALEQAVADHRIFFISGPGKEKLYPSFFVDASMRDAIEQVSVALGDLVGETKWQFFVTPKHSIGRRLPIVAITDRFEVDSVVRAAREFQERSLGR